MAKKPNRSRPKQTTKKPAAVIPEPVEEAVAESPEPIVMKAVPAAKLKRAQATPERLEDEYAYIVGDLRRVLILAAVMFILLIAANVILSRVAF